MDRIVSAVLLVLILFSSSCNQELSNDKSLTLKEYKRLGMPDLNKLWESHDFYLTYAVLENIKSSRPFELPVKGSNRSGLIFEKMISLENMDFINDATLPNIHKLGMARNYLKIAENWISIYSYVHNGRQYYHKELTYTYLFGLEVTEILLDLNEDPHSANEQENITSGINPIQSIYLSGLFNLLQQQGNASQFDESDHELIAKEVTRSINQNKSWIDNTVQSDLKEVLQAIIDNEAVEVSGLLYSELIDSL